MLHDVGEVARESEILRQLVGQRCREVVVHPVVCHLRRCDQRTVGSGGAEVVVDKASHIFAGRVLDRGVLALQSLPLDARAVVGIELRRDVPVVCEVEGVEDALALASVPEAHGVGSVLGHALVVHRRVGAVVDVVVPFVHADAQRGGAEGL